MRILVVEDEARLANLIKRGLSEEGHAVDLAASGEEALDWLDTAGYDVLVLDIMLPGINGLDLCRTMRQQRIATPVLLLTAKDAVADRVAGLDAGADDYLVKPFAFAELSARIRALTRRPAEMLSAVLQVGDVRLDPANREVFRGSTSIELGTKEFRILEFFLRHPNRVLTRSMIAEHVWDYDFPNVTNVIDVHIGSIRRKLGNDGCSIAIQTIRGAGYRLVATA
jgi:two-component system OmpR family response regulator